MEFLKVTKVVFIISVLTFLTACTTALWSDEYYSEELTGFYIDEKNQKLIVSASQYSYVFNLDDDLKELLIHSRKVEMSPWFNNFVVDSKNQINGEFRLNINYNALDDEQRKVVSQHGLTQLKSTFQLRGKRYLLEGSLPEHKLETKIPLDIARPSTPMETISKIVATPLAVTYDIYVTVPISLLMVMIMGLGSP